MKRILLFAIITVMVNMLTAQMPVNIRQATKMPVKSLWLNKADDVVLQSYGPVKPANYKVKNINTLGKIPFASSFNIFTALVSESNCLTYDAGINTLMFTHRAGGPYGGSGNDVTFSYTSDMGGTFNYVTVNGSPNKLRYPSGVIYNPSGNTNPSDAFGLAMGPSLIGAGFDTYYYLSAKLDSTDFDFNSLPNNAPPLPQYFPRIGFAACDDGTQHILGHYDDGNQAAGSHNIKYMVMNNFSQSVPSKGYFDWTYSTVKVPLFNAPGDGKDVFSGFNTAWSQDGATGYLWVVGVDSLDTDLATVPLVYKSVDQGATWSALPYFDFTTNSTIMSHLNDWWQGVLGYSGVPRVNFVDWYAGSDGVVDANNNLHIFTLVGCGFGVTRHPDSLGFVYSYEPKLLYDVYTTSTGWDAVLVDTIWTGYVPAASSGFGSGADAVGWDHRIQASRSNDGTKIFCVWTDSDTTFTDVNNLPDVLAKGFDVNTGYKTPTVNFTKNSSYDGDNFFMYVSDRVIVQGTDFIIPVVTAAIGGTPDDPPTWELLTGISFNETDFTTGIGKHNDNLRIVSQNYPNPFKGSTSINISLQKPAFVKVDVLNIIGQQVLQVEAGTMGAGQHTIKLNAESLKPGLYLYKVYADNYGVTGKMIVE